MSDYTIEEHLKIAKDNAAELWGFETACGVINALNNLIEAVEKLAKKVEEQNETVDSRE